MDPNLLGPFEADQHSMVFAPERPDREMIYHGLSCACGAHVFRLTGWPHVVTGRGGFFWRSVARVWREARLPMQEGEPVESPFWIPLEACCDHCGRIEALFDFEQLEGRMDCDARSEPRESIRCRACRRSLVEIVVGIVEESGRDEGVAPAIRVEIVSRCHRCHRQARVAWSDPQRSPQEIQLDLLYGRR